MQETKGAKVAVERPVVIYEFRTPYGGVQGFTLRPDLGDTVRDFDTGWAISQPRLKETTIVLRVHVLACTIRETTTKVMEPLPPPAEETPHAS